MELIAICVKQDALCVLVSKYVQDAVPDISLTKTLVAFVFKIAQSVVGSAHVVPAKLDSIWRILHCVVLVITLVLHVNLLQSVQLV
jgi:hypothetical protein